ncbi:hypothetical protein MUP65_01310 [Patescibacteria group bacterium]|nr:hypothetical protein [Patescibacteria group bacterium]
MIKKLQTSLLLLSFLIQSCAYVWAKSAGDGGSDSQGSGTGSGVSEQQNESAAIQEANQSEPVTVQSENQEEPITTQDEGQSGLITVQSENQVKTINQGEDEQLQVSSNYSLQLMTQKIAQVKAQFGTQSGYGEKVLGEIEILESRQQRVQQALEDIDARQGLLRNILGPKYKQLNLLTEAIGEGWFQIRILEGLQTQVANQAEDSAIQELISALKEQNTALEEKILEEEAHPGWFGWLGALFV